MSSDLLTYLLKDAEYFFSVFFFDRQKRRAAVNAFTAHDHVYLFAVGQIEPGSDRKRE